MSKNCVQALGMVWYLPEDFDEIKFVMEDGTSLHQTYAEWQNAAEQGEERLRALGVPVYRAILRPIKFRAWCHARGHRANAQARNDFAAEFARSAFRAEH